MRLSRAFTTICIYLWNMRSGPQTNTLNSICKDTTLLPSPRLNYSWFGSKTEKSGRKDCCFLSSRPGRRPLRLRFRLRQSSLLLHQTARRLNRSWVSTASAFPSIPMRPPVTIEVTARYSATIRTNLGTIVIDLFADQAPVTVNNFIFLANDGFYDGVIFHRVIPSFMIQGGDPTGTGSGGPGYRFQDEIAPGLTFDQPGKLAMANAGPGTNGSQFFITTVSTPHLNGAHTIFGQVAEGQDIVDAISLTETGAGNRPSTPVVIQGIEIAKNP